MQKLLVSNFSLLFTLIISSVASGQFHGFPEEIQSRFDSGEFVITQSDYLGLGIDGFSPTVGAFFEYLDVTQTPAEERVIIRYNIGGDSIFRSTFQYDTTDIAMTGIIHMDASKRYEGSFSSFTLFLEDMDQTDEIFTGIFPHSTIRLGYTSAEALISGFGDYRECIDYYDPECMYGTGDLFAQDTPQVCLAEGCEIGATFWMTRIGYFPSGTGLEIDLDPFAFGETEFPPLYEQRQSFPGFPDYDPDQSQSLFQRFELAPVLPGDINRDGVVNLLDVSPFVELINSGDYRFEGDINRDLRISLLDIPAFVNLLGS